MLLGRTSVWVIGNIEPCNARLQGPSPVTVSRIECPATARFAAPTDAARTSPYSTTGGASYQKDPVPLVRELAVHSPLYQGEYRPSNPVS